MSEARWRSLGLDDDANYTDAILHISHVIRVFEYLHEPKIQGYMREIFNLAHKEIEIYQTVLNTFRSEKGETSFNLTGLWEEFIQ